MSPSQAVHRLVGELPAGLGAAEDEHGQHGTEDFFPRDRHLGLHLVEYGGLDVVALPIGTHRIAAGNECRAFVLPLLDVGEHRLLLLLRDQRAEAGAFFRPVLRRAPPVARRQPPPPPRLSPPLPPPARPGRAHLTPPP